jgi:hypothetical protein
MPRVTTLVRLVALSTAVAAPASASTRLPYRIDDSFTGHTLDGSTWVTDSQSPGTTQVVDHGSLQLTATSAAAAGLHDGILTLCQAQGDFDARVSFTLPVWPADDGVSVALNAPNLGNAFIQDAVGGDTYGLFVHPTGLTTRATHDTGGGLRLTRTGDMTSAYKRVSSSSQWTRIAHFSGPTTDTWAGVAIWNIEGFGGLPVTARTDSFHLRAAGLSCPPG